MTFNNICKELKSTRLGEPLVAPRPVGYFGGDLLSAFPVGYFGGDLLSAFMTDSASSSTSSRFLHSQTFKWEPI